MTRPFTPEEIAVYATHRFAGGVPCQHGVHIIKPYAGIWFAVGAGAVCHDSPDTQHRPHGVPVPEPRQAPRTGQAKAAPPLPLQHMAATVLMAADPPPASVIARCADTDSTHGAAGRKRWN